ncbi:MAG: outer membrane protein assembly factor BamE [Alphaproteobacteria bacterium]
MFKLVKLFFFSSFICFLLSSCISQKEIHGNLPEAQLVSLLQIGKDNKKTVSNILGQPTFAGTLGDNSFYYVGTVNSKVAFLYPSVHEQYVLELNFDKKDNLKNIYIYDENQSMEVAMSNLETTSSGQKETFLQSLIRNFGVPTGGSRGVILGSGKADD